MAIGKFNVGDMVIGNDPERYAFTCKGWKGVVKKVHDDGRIDVLGKGNKNWNTLFTGLEPQYFDLVKAAPLKYKIGDRVYVSDNLNYYKNKPGTIVDICECYKNPYRVQFEDDKQLKLWSSVSGLVEPKYKVGDRVYASDNIGLNKNKPGTIVGVWYTMNHPTPYSVKFDGYKSSLWSSVSGLIDEKPTAPKPKYYNGKVICIEVGVNTGLYTVGKIYQFKNGVLTADNGSTTIKWGCEPFESFEEFADYSSSKFIPIVE